MFTTKRERLYGGPLSSGPKFHYVTYLDGVQVATAETKEESQRKATKTLLGAFDKQTSFIYATLAADGSIITSREYAPGEVEQGFHRESSGHRGSGVSMGRCTINGAPCSVYEYHMHAVESYNASMKFSWSN